MAERWLRLMVDRKGHVLVSRDSSSPYHLNHGAGHYDVVFKSDLIVEIVFNEQSVVPGERWIYIHKDLIDG